MAECRAVAQVHRALRAAGHSEAWVGAYAYENYTFPPLVQRFDNESKVRRWSGPIAQCLSQVIRLHEPHPCGSGSRILIFFFSALSTVIFPVHTDILFMALTESNLILGRTQVLILSVGFGSVLDWDNSTTDSRQGWQGQCFVPLPLSVGRCVVSERCLWYLWSQAHA